jgi:hypothetical protein
MNLYLVTATDRTPDVDFLLIRARDERDAIDQAAEYVADQTWTAKLLTTDGPAQILAGAERSCWELTGA